MEDRIKDAHPPERTWELTQKEELKYWKTLHKEEETENWYAEFYKPVNDFLNKIECNQYSVADLGCGAYSYVCRFNFRKIYLVDSLMDKFNDIKHNLSNNAIKMSDDASKIKLDDNIIDTTFALNCLDHMPTVKVAKTLKLMNMYTNSYIVIAVDHRDEEDEHHYVFEENFTPLTRFDLTDIIRYKRGDRWKPVKGAIYFFENKDKKRYVFEKYYWWGNSIPPDKKGEL